MDLKGDCALCILPAWRLARAECGVRSAEEMSDCSSRPEHPVP